MGLYMPLKGHKGPFKTEKGKRSFNQSIGSKM